VTDLLLDDDWDVEITNNDLVLIPEPADECVQRVVQTAKTYLGEWMFDVEAGYDWRGLVFRKGADMQVASASMRALLETDPEVEGVRDIEFTADNASRTGTGSARVDTSYGTQYLDFDL
jgi:hypothetical protein